MKVVKHLWRYFLAMPLALAIMSVSFVIFCAATLVFGPESPIPGPWSSGFKVSFEGGSFSGEFSGRAHFVSCARTNDSPLYPVMWFSSNSDSSWIRIDLVPDTTSGKNYSFSQTASPGTGYLIIGELHFINGELPFDKTSLHFSSSDVISGDVEFDAFPSAPNQPVRGSFRILTQDNLKGDVIVRGRFDFKSSGDASYDCLRQ